MLMVSGTLSSRKEMDDWLKEKQVYLGTLHNAKGDVRQIEPPKGEFVVVAEKHDNLVTDIMFIRGKQKKFSDPLVVCW